MHLETTVLWCCVSREAAFKSPAVSHVVNTIISLLPHFPFFLLLFHKKGNLQSPQYCCCRTRKIIRNEKGLFGWWRVNLDKDKGRGDEIRKKCKSSTQTVYNKTEKAALQLLPKYAQHTGMQRGALSERNKDSTVSGSLSPVLPHPHIISWKIPDICCNFSLFSSSSSCCCWYRQGFNIQIPVCAHMCTRTHQSVLLLLELE